MWLNDFSAQFVTTMLTMVEQTVPCVKSTSTKEFIGNWLTKLPQKVEVVKPNGCCNVTTVTCMNTPPLPGTLVSCLPVTVPLILAVPLVNMPLTLKVPQPSRETPSNALSSNATGRLTAGPQVDDGTPVGAGREGAPVGAAATPFPTALTLRQSSS